MITTSLRSTSRALHVSSRRLTIGRSGASRFFVGSHSIESTRRDVDATVSPRRSIFQTSTHPVPLYSSYSLHKALPKIRPVEGNDSSCRYFSKESPDGTDIDRSKFTVEVPIEMPDMGDDLEGVIVKWHKKEGDLIKKEDIICDIETKVFTFGMMTDDSYSSIMGEICVPEQSDPIKAGTVICKTLNEGGSEEDDDDDEEDMSKYQDEEAFKDFVKKTGLLRP